MNTSPDDILAQARQLRANASEMLRQAELGQTPIPGQSAEAARLILTENIAAYDEMIRRNEHRGAP
jgi:hypothetical protein